MGYTKGRSGVSSVDTSTKHVLAQYGIFDDDEEEDFEKELSVGEEVRREGEFFFFWRPFLLIQP